MRSLRPRYLPHARQLWNQSGTAITFREAGITPRMLSRPLEWDDDELPMVDWPSAQLVIERSRILDRYISPSRQAELANQSHTRHRLDELTRRWWRSGFDPDCDFTAEDW